MKIDIKAANTTSNIPRTNTTRMAIDVDGMEHIMALLTNLYKDRELAVIREYYTNALDAHVEAGVSKAVKITLPTWDDPTYVVQDFGVGMSEWDIKNVFSQYGASTKRNSNEQVGAFGLGCKSAFAITTQFTVLSVKMGMKCTTLFSMVENGTYESTVVSNVETDEPQGTIIKIPVDSDLWEFNNTASKFFSFSKPGSVLVDGKEPKNVLDGTTKIVDPTDSNMYLHLKPNGDGESYVIMGSVPYALSNEEIKKSLQRLNVTISSNFVRMPKYFPVPIGAVDLTPSREGLRFTDKTNEAIDKYISFIVNDLRKIAEDEMDTAETLEDLWSTYKRWNGIVSLDLKYKGEMVPRNIQLDADYREIQRTDYGTAAHSEGNHLYLNFGNTMRTVVTGLSADSYKKVNSYLTPYMTAKGISSAVFVVTDSKDIHTDKWIKMSKMLTFVDSADLISIGKEQRKLDRKAASTANGTSKRPKIKYPVLNLEDEEITWIDHDEIAQDTPYIQSSMFYGGAGDFVKATYKSQYDHSISETLVKYFSAVTDVTEIILLGNSRTVKALEQRIKETRPLLPDITASLKKRAAEALTDDVVKHQVVAQSSWKRFLTSSGLDKHISEIKDEAIIEIISPSKDTLEAYKRFETTCEAIRYFNHNQAPSVPSIHYAAMQSVHTINTLDKKYPLVSAVNSWNMESTAKKHMVKYLNLIHEEHKLLDILNNK